VGFAQFFKGNIAEIIIGSSTLSTQVRQKIQGHAAHAYDLTGKLPSDHPYKNSPPRKLSS
jgi:hypothetical protein